MTQSRALLRREMKARRRAYAAALSAAERDALEHAIAQQVAAQVPAGSIVGSYWSTAAEVDPAQTEVLLRAKGCTIALPRVDDTAPSMRFHRWYDKAALEQHRLGFLQPKADAPEVTPSVLLVPLVAATRNGARLGQGGGHYDRTLAALRANGTLHAIGLAWDMQIVDHLEEADWDQRLDVVVSPG
jgi:5-formyltetrahydrofolate cyclo-ligase